MYVYANTRKEMENVMQRTSLRECRLQEKGSKAPNLPVDVVKADLPVLPKVSIHTSHTSHGLESLGDLT